MEFGSLDDGECGDHKSVDFLMISKIFAMEFAYFFGTEPLDKSLRRTYFRPLA